MNAEMTRWTYSCINICINICMFLGRIWSLFLVRPTSKSPGNQVFPSKLQKTPASDRWRHVTPRCQGRDSVIFEVVIKLIIYFFTTGQHTSVI